MSPFNGKSGMPPKLDNSETLEAQNEALSNTAEIKTVSGREFIIPAPGKKMPTLPNGEIDPEADIDPEHLVLIRETAHKAVQDEQGRWYIPSPYEATKNSANPEDVQYRYTSHLALNHQVAPHGLRPSVTEGYIFFLPLQEVMKLNGNPANMDPVDTYFRTDRLYLPEKTVAFKIGEVNTEEVIAKMGFTPLKADQYRVDPNAEQAIEKLADKLGVDIVPNFKSLDGLNEGYLKGLNEGNLTKEPLDVILGRYDAPGFEFYNKYIREGAERMMQKTTDPEIKTTLEEFLQSTESTQ